MEDDDLNPEESLTTFSTENSQLIFHAKAISEKYLQKAVNVTVPSIELVKQTIEAFSLL
jgi:hypothetical protein